jgi:uncharacterized protein (DUF305 family)
MLAVTLSTTAIAVTPLTAQKPPATAPARDYTQADVDFVQGMIMHHAQAVVMSDWATTHDARPDLQILCKRIALSQRDEITMMQQWLQDRHLPVPDPLHMLHPAGHGAMHDGGAMHMPGMNMSGMDMNGHQMTMPGMLTPEQLHQLDAARGPAFDRLYLTGMIRHHEGALTMVASLFATPGAGQQPEISTFAIDVDASQRAEIARMEAMLNTLTTSQTR